MKMGFYKRADLVGVKTGMLTVIEFSHVNTHAYWKCKCECGNETVLPTNKIAGKNPTKSCGCLTRSNLTGQRFNRLVVIGPTGKKKDGNYTWLCKCDCGEEVEVKGSLLTTGGTQSCGCLNWDNRNKHGMTNTPLHHVWNSAKRRCEKENNHAYKNYGARGIYMCEEWRENFLAFYEWARANGYKEGLSLDRIDNDGPYSPENCRWVTAREQNRNSRNTRHLTLNGETKCITEWAEKYNMKASALVKRLARMSLEEALNKPYYIRPSARKENK
jgi:hypothetical protein